MGVFAASLCFVVFSLAGALQVSILKPEYEFARGDNITLPCKFTPKSPTNKLVIIIWSIDDQDPNNPAKMILTHYSSGTTDVPPLYEGRASLDMDIPTGKANLKLSQITLQDNKIFSCRLQIPGDDEGTLVDSTRLVVLVAPSKPVCAIQGKAEYGQNINLTCLSAEGSPTPVYTWDQKDVRNAPRPRDPRTTDKGGVLSLYNISMETSGYYTCVSRNKIRAATCNLTLTVLPPSMNMGATAGIIGAAVGVLLLLGIVIFCCCCRKKKAQEEKYAMGTPEEGEFKDAERLENGKLDRRDDRAVDGQSEAGTARRSDYDDRRSDYDDRRSDYDDRRSDYDDRRSDYTDRRDRYDDDRRYDDRDDRRRADDRDDRRRDDDRDDRRRDDDRDDRRRYDEPYDDAEPARPKPPANKPPRPNYDD